MYAYLDSNNECEATSFTSKTIEEVQINFTNAITIIPNAPDDVVHKGQDLGYFHKLVSGDGTDLSHYIKVYVSGYQPPMEGFESQSLEFQYSESLIVSTATGTSFLNKLSLTTYDLPYGLYCVACNYGWALDTTSHDFESRVTLNGDLNTDNLIFMHRQEPKDSNSSGSGRYAGIGTDQYLRFHGVRYLTLSGISVFNLSYRSTKHNKAASIWDASISLERKK